MPITIDAVFARLPDRIGTEDDLDAVLRRIGGVPAWDRAKLAVLRHAVLGQKLVVRDDSGTIIKAQAPRQQPTEADALVARQEMERDHMRREALAYQQQDEALHGHERQQFRQAVDAHIAPRLKALEERLEALEERFAEMADHVPAA